MTSVRDVPHPSTCACGRTILPYYGRRDLVQLLRELEPLLESRNFANLTEELIDRDDRAARAYARVGDALSAIDGRCSLGCTPPAG